MNMVERAPSRPDLSTRLLDWTSAVLFALISLFYVQDAVAISAHSPFWMDEVLALWTARQPDQPAVWAALQKGSEFTPPLYDSFLHFWIKTGANSPLMLRLPSIVAGYMAALAMGELVRRRAGWPLAALAAGSILTGTLFDFSVQLRPYVFVTAAFGWALVIWDNLPDDGHIPLRRLLALGTLLTAMIALHFYALLLVATLGLGEITRRYMGGHTPRMKVALTIGISATTILCWWPIIHAASQFSRLDVFATGYYGRPLISHLGTYYVDLWGLPGLIAFVPGFAILVRRRTSIQDIRLGVLALVLCAIPALVFAFALAVSHSFALRYVLAGVFGVVLGLVWFVRQSGESEAIWSVSILLLLAVFSHNRGIVDIAKQDQLNLFAMAMSTSSPALSDLPIATGNGLRYLELMANLPAKVTRRLIYVDLPDFPTKDPTNMHQVERWKAIDGTLRVINGAKFICATPRFLLLTDAGSADDELPAWLHGRTITPENRSDRPSLSVVQIRGNDPLCQGFAQTLRHI